MGLSRVLLLSDPDSVHTVKWANSLNEFGFDITVVGLGSYSESTSKKYKKVNIYGLGCSVSKDTGIFDFLYTKKIRKLRKLVRKISPDIVHAHYATSYGLLGSLLKRHPYIISVWGADVYEFPRRSLLHKGILKYNLSQADRILSTSNCMATEAKKYTRKNIEVTPFGVDLDVFKPARKKEIGGEEDVIVGTIKTLEKKYGIEYLIRAFSMVVERHTSLSLKLLIVGGGRLEQNLKQIVTELDLKDRVIFTGEIPHKSVPEYFNVFSVSVSVSVSDSESFGVAVIEACACEKPVVVSNVGGLPEVVEDGITGLVVKPKDPLDTANAIEKLVLDRELRDEMGKKGRERVRKLYNWDENVRQMAGIYLSVLDHKGQKIDPSLDM